MRLGKKSLTLMGGVAALAMASSAQAVVVDGTLSAQEGYTSVAAWTQGATGGGNETGFGDHGILEILVNYDSDSVNIFVVGTPEENGNAVMLWVDNSGVGTGASVLPNGSDGLSPFNNAGGTTLDFAADLGFRIGFNSGNVFTSAIDYRSGGNTDTFLGNSMSGTLTATAPYEGLQSAYNDGTGNLSTNTGATGWEISIPYAVIGDATQDLNVFAAYASGDGGFFSANTVPEIPGQATTNLGTDPDFSAAAGSQVAAVTSPILLVNPFEDDTSATFSTIADDATFDFTSEYGTAFSIPDAPRSAAIDSRTSQGLALAVNSLGTATSGNVFTNDVFSGNYKVTVDKYQFTGSGGGSTVAAAIGVNHSGTRGISYRQGGGSFIASTDGYMFHTATDSGTSLSYIFQDGNPSAFPANDLAGLSWADGLLLDSTRIFTDDLFDVELYPADGFSLGEWTTIDMIVDNGYVIVKADGDQVLSYLDLEGDVWTTGSVLLGMEDRFNSISNTHRTIFDNLVVSEIVTAIDPVAGTVDDLTLDDDTTTATLTWDGFSDADTGIVSYTLTVSGGTFGPTSVGGVESFDVTAPAPGTYTVTVEGFDSSGASDSATGTLEILNNAKVSDWTTLGKE